MLLGLVMLTAAWAVTQNGWVIFYTWSLCVLSCLKIYADKLLIPSQLFMVLAWVVNTP